jgi:hypothetical protein
MTNNEHLSMRRQLVDRALEWGRRRLSAQTGFIHFHAQSLDPEPHQAIPLVENSYFALALIRSHIAEQVQQGKEVIKRLLAFQGKEGNFPLYLHDYPLCQDRKMGVELLTAWHVILREYHSILGTELLQKLVNACHQLLYFCYQSDVSKPYYAPLALRLAALLSMEGRKEEAQAIFQRLEQNPSEYDKLWSGSQTLGHFLLAYHIAPQGLPERFLQEGFQRFQHRFHPHASVYVGPAVNELQNGEEPDLTLSELFLNAWKGRLPLRALRDHPVQLLGALFFEKPEMLEESTLPVVTTGEMDQNPWLICQKEHYAYSALMQTNYAALQHKGFHLFRAVWPAEEPMRIHTMVCQGAKGEVSYQQREKGLDWLFQLPPAAPEESDRAREVCFAVNRHSELQVLVNGHKASLFYFGDTLEITSGKLRFKMVFEKVKGEGDFTGHLMPGNRLAQIANKGTLKYEAFDLLIFMKTLRRSSDCHIVVRWEIAES